MKSYFETENYEQFLAELHSVTSIDSRILDSLIKLNLIKKIFENEQSILINENYFSFFQPQLNYKYKEQIEFVFASYPLHNTNFNEISYQAEAQLFKRRISNNDFKSFISFAHNDNLTLVIKSDYQLFSKYDISLLNFDEKFWFEEYIKSIFISNLEFIPVTNSSHHNELFFAFKPLTILESFDSIDQHIHYGQKRYLYKLEEIKNNHQSVINSFFERALLEIEMENF